MITATQDADYAATDEANRAERGRRLTQAVRDAGYTLAMGVREAAGLTGPERDTLAEALRMLAGEAEALRGALEGETAPAGCLTPDRVHVWTGGTPQYTRAGTLQDVAGEVTCQICGTSRPVAALPAQELWAVCARVARAHTGRVLAGRTVTEPRPVSDRFAQYALIAYGVRLTDLQAIRRRGRDAADRPTAEIRAPHDMWLTVTVGPRDPGIDDRQRFVTAEQLARVPLDPRLAL